MTTRRLWVPVLAALVGALLAVMLVGPLGARQEAGALVEPRVTNRTITIPAGAFSPNSDSQDFVNDGSQLWTTSGHGYFTAPLFFEAPVVTVKKITLYAYDNNSSSEVCVALFRTTPTTGSQQTIGGVCSSGASTTNPQVFTQTSLTHRRVTGAYGPYLWVSLPGSYSDGYRFYGVKITYS